jgi:hypothetical protein
MHDDILYSGEIFNTTYVLTTKRIESFARNFLVDIQNNTPIWALTNNSQCQI